MAKEMTNAEFAQTDLAFKNACAKMKDYGFPDFKPTARQASKWLRGMGIVYKVIFLKDRKLMKEV